MSVLEIATQSRLGRLIDSVISRRTGGQRLKIISLIDFLPHPSIREIWKAYLRKEEGYDRDYGNLASSHADHHSAL
jgi:hypothetical protein